MSDYFLDPLVCEKHAHQERVGSLATGAALIAVFCLFAFAGCADRDVHDSQTRTADNVEAVHASGPRTMAPAAFAALDLADSDIVVDVRTPEEFQGGHLDGAYNFDVRSASFRSQIASLDTTRTYYLYCRTGNRSRQAAEAMVDMGFTAIYNIGGLTDLERAGVTVVR